MLEPDTSLSVGVRLLLTDRLPLLLSNYIGNIAVFGFCSWLFIAQMKERLLLIGLIAVSLLCAFGSYTPVYLELYKWLPGFHSIRFPEKFYFITFALLLFGTIRGIGALIDGGNCRGTRIILLGVPAGWLITYLIVRLNPNLLAHWIQPFQASQAMVPPATIAAILFSMAEALGLSLTGCAAIPGPYRERGQMAYETGKRIVDMPRAATGWCTGRRKRETRPCASSSAGCAVSFRRTVERDSSLSGAVSFVARPGRRMLQG